VVLWDVKRNKKKKKKKKFQKGLSHGGIDDIKNSRKALAGMTNVTSSVRIPVN
jgi:hypothetical protein